jgi:hypothetical protein
MAEENYFDYVSVSGELESETAQETPGYELAYLKDLIEDEEELAAAFGDGYPGSVQAGWPEAGSGTLLSGDVITGVVDGMHCWNNEGSNALKVFDGDLTTFFDPVDADTDYWCGVDLGSTYRLTEIRIHPREEWAVRLAGGAVQGSNDGENWTTVWSGEKLASGLKYEKVDATTNKITASFAKTEAKFVMFALTAPRSRDASGVSAFNQKYGVTAEVNANPHYFRIVEFELYEAN